MQRQIWLPPLNSHPNFYTLIAAKQLYHPNAFYLPISKAAEPVFSMFIKVMVKFYSEDSTKKRSVIGLSLFVRHFIPFSDFTSAPAMVGKGKIMGMINLMGIGFQMKNIFFKRKHFGENVDITWEDDNLDIALHKIWDFLCAMMKKPCNEGYDCLPFYLSIKKMVCIPDSQLSAWRFWIDHRKEADQDFGRRYQSAISRPRTVMELFEPLMHATKAASESAIEALEVVNIGESSSAANTDTNCVVCLEELQYGSKASRLPCSHVFHKECIVNWLQESHMCPQCRFELPLK